jgi:ribosomal protein S18 acetylase RimI-like enzyme
MNRFSMPEIIEENLFDLYEAFAVAGNYSVKQQPCFTVIRTQKSVFPGNVFRIDPGMDESSLLELVRMIKKGQAPPFLIFRTETASPSFISRLKASGIRQVMQWPGMAAELSQVTGGGIETSHAIRIRKVRKPDEINDWAEIVSMYLFNHEKLDIRSLTTLARGPNCCLYTAFSGNIPAGTLLSYGDKGVLGLYMLVVMPECRKKGIAGNLLQEALRDARGEGFKYAVLEATMQGLSLYRNMGFKEYCNFGIYWMLGKNNHHEGRK